MPQNHEYIFEGFRRLRDGFAPYVCGVLKAEFGASWWQKGVLDILWDDQKQSLPTRGREEDLVGALDIKACLALMDVHWNRAFRSRLAPDYRNWGRELRNLRNNLAHMGSKGPSDDEVWRGLDTMARVASEIAPAVAQEIRGLMLKARQDSKPASEAPAASGSLPAWRDVMEPHPDVAQGRYRNAEFAADLAQVARGEGSFEYADPVEFFSRTYITEGMKTLLAQALARLSGRGGEPVIQLKTAFGGGKTHSMLALYHLVRGKAPVGKMPGIKPVLESQALQEPPRAHVAVLVGSAIDPTRSKHPADLPGVTVNTLWGELAYQLAVSAGKPELYDLVKEADKMGISPGSEALQKLFDGAGSCMVLVDEFVAYAKKLPQERSIPAGNFDNFITFVQELTEAARASKSSLVVASIPESEIEIGGKAGQQALKAIEHTFGRMEAIWKPVAASEGFEIVRRRLFLDCGDEAARDRVCAAYSALYNENREDFPVEARDAEYRKRLAACYPIHPEVFDRLYEDWATLERFQRTRGVLRLMAAVIHELWTRHDQSPLIQPGNLPLDSPPVRDELTRHLDSNDNWNGILDKEVDGRASVPFGLDQSNARYGKLAASRRIARTIMLGSAPSVRQQRVRGIEAGRIRLGVAQPGESISVFNDALSTLQTTLAYLYSNATFSRFWYDTRPNLRKTMEEKCLNIKADNIEWEIEKMLRHHCKRKEPLAGVHVCPASSLDVPDEQTCRLVVLGPAQPFMPGDDNCAGMTFMNEIFANRGQISRSWRNMLFFLVADQRGLVALQDEVRRYLAWEEIKSESELLNLDASQNRETDTNIRRCRENLAMLLQEAWRWLLVPSTDRNDLKKPQWELSQLGGKDGELVAKAVSKLLNDEAIIRSWAPSMLNMELNSLLWQGRDHLEIRHLWDYLASYCYLPRLANFEVLASAIEKGVENSDEYFAWAAGHDEEMGYIDLKYNSRVRIGDKNQGMLVKTDAARAQIERQQAGHKAQANRQEPAGLGERRPAPLTNAAQTAKPVKPEPVKRRFYLSQPIDHARAIRDVEALLKEVINQLAAGGASVEINLDVEATAPQGFDQNTTRIVAENCKTLNIADFGFSEN